MRAFRQRARPLCGFCEAAGSVLRPLRVFADLPGALWGRRDLFGSAAVMADLTALADSADSAGFLWTLRDLAGFGGLGRFRWPWRTVASFAEIAVFEDFADWAGFGGCCGFRRTLRCLRALWFVSGPCGILWTWRDVPRLCEVLWHLRSVAGSSDYAVLNIWYVQHIDTSLYLGLTDLRPSCQKCATAHCPQCSPQPHPIQQMHKGAST